MHKAENIRGYPYLCIRRGPVEQIKEPECATNTTDATGPTYEFDGDPVGIFTSRASTSAS